MAWVVPIHYVLGDGSVERLGEWNHDTKRLTLVRHGFPFLAPGEHVIEGDLPWIFWDMAPSGFMGARFAAAFPELQLPANPNRWSPEDTLRALSSRGEDLTGHLLIGADSLERFNELALRRREATTPVEDFVRGLTQLQDLEQASSAASSVGGERPKFAVHASDGDSLVKYSPPVSTELGARWAQLLRAEALCLGVLRTHDVQAATANSFVTQQADRRVLLVVERFDRTRSGGRRSFATCQWLAMSRQQADRSAPEVLRSLHRDELLDDDGLQRGLLAHAFSSAIGNTDTHLGNYGLVFPTTGPATLAPLYDVLPMVFAPRHDELPDAYLKPRKTPVDPTVVPMVRALVEQINASYELAPEFKAAWLAYIGPI